MHGDEDDCRKMFKMMKSSHIGLQHPEFFLHWAEFELKIDRKDKSLAVLSSANDTPIMRGNLQIKEAKELIESDQNLKLQPLFSLNLSTKKSSLPSPSSSLVSQDSLNEKFSKISRTEIGLGPAKRVKEEKEKENLEITSLQSQSVQTIPAVPLTALSNDLNTLNNVTGQSGNSNMSLTMTELNINIKTTKNPTDDTGTLNLTSNSLNTTKIINNNTVINNNLTNPTSSGALKSRQVRVNGKIYRVLQLIGRGGSSKVFRVIDAEGQIFALKKVNLKNLDEVTLNSYTNEISLLKSFANNPHIIQLIDSEMNKEQACLYILMEYGEVDLGKMLKNRVDSGLIGEKADENFIRFSFQQVRLKQ